MPQPSGFPRRTSLVWPPRYWPSGHPAQGLLRPDKVAASSHPEHQAPWREPSLSRLHGVDWVLVALSLHGEPRHCLGRLAGGGLSPAWHREGRSALCSVHSRPSRGSRATCGGRACFTHLRPGGTGATGFMGLRARGQAAARRPPPRPALSDTVETETFFSVLCLSRSRGGEEGRAPGAAAGGEGSLPSPITGTDLIYLFWLKKKEQKQLSIAFGLTHKRSYPRACLRVLLSLCPPTAASQKRLTQASHPAWEAAPHCSALCHGCRLCGWCTPLLSLPCSPAGLRPWKPTQLLQPLARAPAMPAGPPGPHVPS